MMRIDFERPTSMTRTLHLRSSSRESTISRPLETPAPANSETPTPTTSGANSPASLPPFDVGSDSKAPALQVTISAPLRHRPAVSADPLKNVTAHLIKHLPWIRLGAELVSAALISLIFLLVLKALLLTLIGEGL